MTVQAIASGNWNAAGDWVSAERPFSADELEAAVEWRQSVLPDPTLSRRDHCPHGKPCASLEYCIAAIAWYFRHREAIERREA